jgi:hypothetical protein
MPTLSGMKLPPPKSPEEFEEIVLSALRIKWSSPNLTMHGRKGQSQDGVDIYGEDDLGRLVGVQCKNTDLLAIGTILAEIKNAELFSPKLNAFYVATSMSSDSRLQKEVRMLSKDRVEGSKFPVAVFFWGDIIQELVKNEPELGKYYPQIVGRSMAHGAELLGLFDVAYHGLRLKYFSDLFFGETGFGVSASEKSYEIRGVGNLVEACSLVVMSTAASVRVRQLVWQWTEIHLAVLMGEAGNGWEEKVDHLASQVKFDISAIEYSLSGKRLAAFSIGRILGNWETSVSRLDRLSRSDVKAIKGGIAAVSSSGKVPASISSIIDEFQTSTKISKALTPQDVYSSVRSMIQFQEMTHSAVPAAARTVSSSLNSSERRVPATSSSARAKKRTQAK